jgi:hypothetical protein
MAKEDRQVAEAVDKVLDKMIKKVRACWFVCVLFLCLFLVLQCSRSMWLCWQADRSRCCLHARHVLHVHLHFDSCSLWVTWAGSTQARAVHPHTLHVVRMPRLLQVETWWVAETAKEAKKAEQAEARAAAKAAKAAEKAAAKAQVRLEGVWAELRGWGQGAVKAARGVFSRQQPGAGGAFAVWVHGGVFPPCKLPSCTLCNTALNVCAADAGGCSSS